MIASNQSGFLKFTAVRTTLLLFLIVILTTGKTQCVADTTTIDCGNTVLMFERQQYDSCAFFGLLHVHENETTAIQAAQWLLDTIRQGSLTTWRVQRQRLVNFSLGSKDFQFDPNRIYSRNGIVATLGKNVPDTVINIVQAISDTFLNSFIVKKKLIVAVHNNTDMGGLSVKSYARGGIYYGDAEAAYINPRRDADDFIYTTDSLFFKYFKRKGYNVVLQNNGRVTDDGSMSVFCARHHILYINVEAEIQHLEQQKAMLWDVWQLIKEQKMLLYPEKD